MKLQKENSHDRDSRIKFDEKPHEYYIDGSKNDIISVTTFIHDFFPKFDADSIIEKMMNSRNWENSKYFGMTKEEIIQEWEDNKNLASHKGTIMHKDIELHWNDEKVENNSKEFKHFLNFCEDHQNLSPFRSEWEIFCDELMLAGSIDMCFRDESGNIVIYDWKRSKNITEENRWDCGFYPVSHLPHSNYWHYSLQLNIYKTILEKHYDKKVSGMYLLWLHPSNDSYIKLEVQDLSEEVDLLFKERLKQINDLG